MYILRKDDGYLGGFGTGTVLAPPEGMTAYVLTLAPESYRGLVEALPGWAGEWRFVVLDEHGMPAAYTPRALTPDEQAADEEAAGRLDAQTLLGQIATQRAALGQAIDNWGAYTAAQKDAALLRLLQIQRVELQVWAYVIEHKL